MSWSASAGKQRPPANSCKARYFCPSCQQKRVLLYSDWVEAMERTPQMPSRAWPVNSVLPITYHPVPDIA